jgi:hypothetical protein
MSETYHDEPNRFCIGLDLGKQTDFSALALLQWHVQPPPPPMVAITPRSPVETVITRRPVYAVPTLVRWPIGTPYRKIVQNVADFFRKPPLDRARPLLVVDATGVGDAVYEMVREQLYEAGAGRGATAAVVITAGSAETNDATEPGRWRVAKKQLVSVLQVLLGQRRLHIAKELPEAKTLHSELGTFSVKITEHANETFESWRERDHDDLVLAVALAAWAAEKLDYFNEPVLAD